VIATLASLALNQSRRGALIPRMGTRITKAKSFWVGAGLAAVAGLLMGAVARPDLRADDRPEGPQILTVAGGARSTGPFDDGQSFASYRGQVPDYVLGTDWKKATAAPSAQMAEAPPPAKLAEVDDPPNLPLTHAAYDDAASHASPIYPSMRGGAPHGADLLPPAHPEDDDSGG
jgi:hypothetical protein